MTTQKKPKGFATMDPQDQREIAALGGRTAHAMGRAHKWTREQARAAAARSVEVRRAKLLAKVATAQ
jgi:hypothetical protein